MKKALINNLEPGRICEVVDIGSEFDVSEDFQWIDCPDDITVDHTLEDGIFVPFDITKVDGFATEGYKVARSIAYGSVGDQLDSIYKEIQETGRISSDGDWASHITSVKEQIPKDDPEAVQQWNIKYSEENLQN